MIRPAAPYEECIAQAVQIADRVRRNLFLAREGDQKPFRAAANRPRHVQLRIEARAPGKNEAAQRRQILVHRIDLALELRHFRRCDARLLRVNVLRLGRENGAEIEQLMLDPPHDSREKTHVQILLGLFFAGKMRQAHERV